MKKILTSLAVISALITGCTTTGPNPDPTHVDKNVLLITETVACAGAAYYAQQQPTAVPKIAAARDALTVLVTESNVSPAQLTAALAPLMNKDSQVWLAPAAVLFAAWSHDYTSGNQILTAIRNGLNCGTFVMPDAVAAVGVGLDRVDIYKDTAGKWRWRRVASNGRIVSVWGESSKWKSNAVRSAKKVNPGVTIQKYE